MSKEIIDREFGIIETRERCYSEKYVQDLLLQLAITEKALELACEDKPMPINYYGNYMGSIKDYIEFYKTKAKEMLENE